MSHIDIARTEGPKAGFRTWKAHLERSGLEGAQNSLAELKAQGNTKAQFEFYCAKFGRKFGSTNARATVARSEHDDDEVSALQERLARLLSRKGKKVTGIQVVKGDDDDLDEVAEPTPRKRTKRAKANEGLSVGDSFVYQAKNGGRSKWTIVRLGETKKHKKPAFICTNGKREAAWNIKSVAIAITEGRITV